MGILISLIVLSLLVFFHELGHFSAARFFGVKVEVFSVGFGKKLYSRMIGNTQWSFSLIPLGGYVKMKGQDDTDPTKISMDSDSYNVKKPWQKIIILLAGPFANFLLAFVLYLIIAFAGVPKIVADIGEISPDTPAFIAKLQKGDRIISINNQPVLYWEDIGKSIESNRGTINIEIKRGSETLVVPLTPKNIVDKNIFGDEVKRKIIGIKPLGTQAVVYLNPIEAIEYAINQTKNATLLITKGVEKLITGAVSSDQVGGVVSIVDITSKASSDGFVTLLFFAALISVNLGVLNLLPIPALDGGHIVFNLYEMITKKAPSDAVLYNLTLVGWGLLIGLMFLGLYNDINRLLG